MTIHGYLDKKNNLKDTTYQYRLLFIFVIAGGGPCAVTVGVGVKPFVPGETNVEAAVTVLRQQVTQDVGVT